MCVLCVGCDVIGVCDDMASNARARVCNGVVDGCAVWVTEGYVRGVCNGVMCVCVCECVCACVYVCVCDVYVTV